MVHLICFLILLYILVVVDDDMPAVEGTEEDAGFTLYTSYVFKKGFFEFEDLGVVKAVELVRDAKAKGGKNELISRIREMIVPYLISYKDTTKISPMNEDFEKGANWELVNDGNGKYVEPKLIPVVRIISRG